MNKAWCSLNKEVRLLQSISYCSAVNLIFSKLPFRLLRKVYSAVLAEWPESCQLYSMLK